MSGGRVYGVDPVEYIKEILMRVDAHPASRIDALLPRHWTPPTYSTDLA
jgi:hypothetical protein